MDKNRRNRLGEMGRVHSVGVGETKDLLTPKRQPLRLAEDDGEEVLFCTVHHKPLTEQILPPRTSFSRAGTWDQAG